MLSQGVVIVVMNDCGQLLMFKRCRDSIGDKTWQFPQGNIDDGETPEQAMYRELKEETNITNIELLKKSKNKTKYIFPEGVYSYRGKHIKGKEHRWFLVKYLGDESEINFRTKPDEIEFSDYKWVKPEEVLDLVVDFKKEVYKEVLKEFFNV